MKGDATIPQVSAFIVYLNMWRNFRTNSRHRLTLLLKSAIDTPNITGRGPLSSIPLARTEATIEAIMVTMKPKSNAIASAVSMP